MQAKIPKINSNKTQRIELNWNETTTIKRYCYYCSNFEPDQCFYFDRSFRFVWGLCGTTKNEKITWKRSFCISEIISKINTTVFGNRGRLCCDLHALYTILFEQVQPKMRCRIPVSVPHTAAWLITIFRCILLCTTQWVSGIALHRIALQMAWHIALRCHEPDNQPKRESLESNHRIKSNPNESN